MFKPFLASIALFISLGAVAEPLALVSAAEAQLPNATMVSTRAITRGPGVKLLTPTEVSAPSFALKIALEPRGGATIDTASIKLEYLKEPSIDLTQRVSAGIKADAIELPQLSLPKGAHHFRVSVKDSEGRATTSTLSLNAK